MIKTIIYPLREEWPQILLRPVCEGDKRLTALCEEVFEAVLREGDDAVRRYAEKFDGTESASIEVADAEFAEAEHAVSEELKEAVRTAAANIEAFHRAQLPVVISWSDEGIECRQEPRAIERVGLYVPGGSAPLFSTVLMLAIPARLAGCREIVLCTPPSADGGIHPAILWCARLCGVDRVFRLGGIQAVAAMSVGTSGVSRVDKIFGPGNRYVTAAKQYAAAYGTAIDMPAGPSEVMVVADGSARAPFVAADLLSQAEHGADSQAILITWERELADCVDAELTRQLAALPRRDIAAQALAASRIIVVRDRTEALDMINIYAPEHLILSIMDDEEFAARVVNAGSVFLGNWSPESAGDYASGTNHTLPTNGWARSYGGLSVESFMKKITLQRLSREALDRLAPTITAMARAEGLDAHANAVTIRTEDNGIK